MALANGDYIIIRDQVIATFNADTGSGGLKEDLGGGETPVKLVEGELKSEPRLYRDHELPAIAVSVAGKKEVEDGHVVFKNFIVMCFIYIRGLDEEEVIEEIYKIAHRLEKVVRDQNRLSATAFGDLSAIDGWDSVVRIEGEITTDIQLAKIKDQQTYGVVAGIQFVLSVGTCFSDP